MSAEMVAAAKPLLGGHAAHLLTLGGPAVALGVFAAWTDLRSRAGGRTRAAWRVNRTLAALAAAGTLVATAVHVDVAPEHFHEAIWFGVFFTVTAACQLAWSALMLTRPKPWTVVAGLVGNAGIVALWAYTRAVAVPIGPEAGRPEEIGVADLVATCAELAVVVLAVWMVVRGQASARSSHEPGSRSWLRSRCDWATPCGSTRSMTSVRGTPARSNAITSGNRRI